VPVVSQRLESLVLDGLVTALALFERRLVEAWLAVTVALELVVAQTFGGEVDVASVTVEVLLMPSHVQRSHTTFHDEIVALVAFGNKVFLVVFFAIELVVFVVDGSGLQVFVAHRAAEAVVVLVEKVVLGLDGLARDGLAALGAL